MADRKKQVKQAIAESVELSKAPTTPAPKQSKKEASGTKDFQLNPREKAEAAAPAHPRAAKSQRFRNRELDKGIAVGRASNPASNVVVNPSVIGHKQVKNSTRYDSSLSSAKTYRQINSEQ
jgi:hypothetical protein